MSYRPAISESAKAYHEKMFPGYASDFLRTDPEFIDRFDKFAFDEVVNAEGPGGSDLDDATSFMAILASLLGSQAIDEFRAMLPAALNLGVTPVEAKEIVYQAVAYLGIGRVFPFLKATNEVLEARGVALPLDPQATTTMETRLTAEAQAQVDAIGEGMRDFWKSGGGDAAHMNVWLTDNCFGDWYTRRGLTVAQREMTIFCFLAAQGGCEPQLIVSNAGYGLFGCAEELTDDEIDRIVATNLVGSIQLIKSSLPRLRRLGGGRIIQMSSYGGQVAYPANSMYHATKFGIEGFCEAVAAEVAQFGIGMTIVEPSGARTEFRYGSAKVARLMPEYESCHGFVNMLDPQKGLAPGDPVRMCQQIIESVEQDPAPLRMVLGRHALAETVKRNEEHLEAFRAMTDLAASTDFPEGS